MTVRACEATKRLHDIKSQAPVLTLHCDRDEGHETKRHYDAAYNVEWYS